MEMLLIFGAYACFGKLCIRQPNVLGPLQRLPQLLYSKKLLFIEYFYPRVKDCRLQLICLL